MFHQLLRFSPNGDEGDGRAPGKDRDTAHPDARGDELPYRVELRDAPTGAVQHVIAIAANATIGYAAYYAAIQDHPERQVTLTYKGDVLSRWPVKAH